MRIHRLEVEAFGPFAEAQHIDFDQLSSQGLFLLNGATGAGKTSILDAICFALYGAVPGARQESKRLRSDHAAPTAEPRVVCEFSARGRRFEVTRTPAWDRPSARGRNGFTTQQAKTLLRERIAGDWQEKSSRNDEVGAELSDVLGMDREQFTRVVMLPQGDFAAFLRSKASDRLELLQKLFGTERFEAVERRLAAQASEAARAVGDNEAQLNVLLARAAAERTHLGLVSASGHGSSGSHAASETGTNDWSGREPGEWLGELEAEIAAEHERRAQQARIAESSSIRAAEKLQGDQDKAQRHSRLAAANQRRVLLELATPRAFEDKERLARHRRAAVLRGQLDAVDSAARRHKAALATEEALHARLESAGIRAASIDSALESVKGTMAVLEARLPDEQRLEETGARLEAQEAQLAKSSAAAEAAAQVRLDLVAQESALLEEAAPLEAVAARAEEAVRAAEAAAGIVELVSRYSVAEAERDGLRARFSEARSHNQDLRRTWLDLREARLANAAGELAAALVDGEACAVCGSTEHPQPADAARSALSLAQEEEDAGLAYEAGDKVLNGIAEQLAAAEQLVAGLAAQGGAMDALEAEAHLASARAEAKEAQAAAARLKALARKLDELKLQMEKVAEDHSSAVAAAGQASSLAALLKEQYSGLQAGLSELAGDYPSLKSRLQALSEERALLQCAADAAQEVQHAGRAWEDAQTALKDALPESGFPTAEEAQRGAPARIRRRGAGRIAQRP
ncbi:SMC family ATPase [Paenarthrobacter sp. S56]|uniref:SMC family ATPase n=1 Tax=Paenarthrobacter sp. S56 TaxID=3138179 RepID=UPI00321BFB6E